MSSFLVIIAGGILTCGMIFCLQLKKEAILISVASFLGWVVGAIFIWLCKNVEVGVFADSSL